MSEKLYWHGKHGLGSGKNAIKQGDTLPDGFSDPRLEKWIDDGTVSEKPFVSFEASKQDELARAKIRITELEGAVAEQKELVKQGGAGDPKLKKDLKEAKAEIRRLKEPKK